MVEIAAIEYSQAGRAVYLGVVKASALVPYLKLDDWRPDNPHGYQRSFKVRRSKRFADFLSLFSGMFHQTILLNIREAQRAKFERLQGNFGTLRVDGDLYQVDGQHRMGGVKILLDSPQRDDFANFPIPVVVCLGFQRAEEALQFFIVNSTQAGVKADLEDRLIADVVTPLLTDEFLSKVIGRKGKRSITEEAVALRDELNENNASVWKGRITFPEQRLTSDLSISQRGFTESLKPLLQNDIIAATFENFPDDLIDPLINY